MTKRLFFEQISPDNRQQYEQALELWIPYIKEIYADDPEENCKTDEQMAQDLKPRIAIQGTQFGMHFELCYQKDGELVGFAFYAYDHGGIQQVLEAGLGYIMEYYIKPEYRRHGYAREMYEHAETMLIQDGVTKLYLTPDSKNGVPFWKAMGYEDSGLIDPDNQMPIYIKDCSCGNKV